MTDLLATRYGPMSMMLIVLPIGLIVLGILSLSTLVMLFRLQWLHRIKTACKAAWLVYGLTFLLGAWWHFTEEPEYREDMTWVAVFVFIPVWQCLLCWFLAARRVRWQGQPERQLHSLFIPWIGLLLWLTSLAGVWWFMESS
jgi:hypothetical protein